jgi:hypothetical protein
MDDSTNTTKTYHVDKHKQLIPLNDSMAHFTCLFEVKNKNKTPFNITIVEQGDIHPKQYKLVEDGYINGQIESDGLLKSYFLVLKAQQPCECEVKISLKPKPAPSNRPNGGTTTHSEEVRPPGVAPNILVDTDIHKLRQESYFQFKYIAAISIIVICLYLLYKYRKNIFNNKHVLAPSTSF